MSRIQAFEALTKDYEAWFDHHPLIYQSELQAVRKLLPEQGEGIEIGVGSGRFAGPLGIRFGIEPSQKMGTLAYHRSINTVRGIAESLPIGKVRFDFVLMVTTICFVDDVIQSFREIHRVLRPGGSFILGFVDKLSPVGQHYYQNRVKNPFYRDAQFYSVEEVLNFLKSTGLHSIKIYQTLFLPLDQIEKVEPVRPGYGEGSFVVIKAYK